MKLGNSEWRCGLPIDDLHWSRAMYCESVHKNHTIAGSLPRHQVIKMSNY